MTVRDATGLSSEESLGFVLSAPCIIKKSISKSEAEAIKRQLEEKGVEVEIK